MVLTQRMAANLIRRGRVLAAVAAAGAMVLLTPGRAEAHAAFVEAEPEPGSTLASAPGAVVLRFTEPLNTSLSRVVVVTPAGERIEGRAAGANELRATLSESAPGVYGVEWVTVSTVDGHTLRGSFRFGVGVDPGPGAEGATGFGPGPGDLVVAVLRAVEYTGLLLAVGLLLLGWLSRDRPDLGWAVRSPRTALLLALVGGAGVVLGEALLAAPRPSVGAAWSFLTTGLPGLARSVRVLAEAVAVLLVGRGRLVAWPVLLAVVALAAAGHAAAVRPRWWGISVDALHLAAAGLWAGGIVALAVVRPAGGWRQPQGRLLLDRFTPVAFVAFLVTVGAGVLRGTQELTGFAELFTTSYGAVLWFKVLAVAAMVPLSILAWRRITGSPRLEALTALVVIGAAALLAAYPLPPARTAETEAQEAQEAGASALPAEGEVSLGGAAGDVLVGLTLRPGRPGPNTLLVYLLPIDGEEAAAGTSVRLLLEGSTIPVQQCGPTCRRAAAELSGLEELEVEVRSPDGGEATFALPELPAPSGRSIFSRAQSVMHDLSTYRIHEVFGPVDPPVRTEYAYQAPDRMRLEASNGSKAVFIGDTRYRWRSDEGRWETQRGGPPVEVPSFIWDHPDLQTPFVVDAARLTGRATKILSVFGMSGQIPIWFRLWIDEEGLVSRAEMRAQGHFMDHRYSGFNEALQIRVPKEGER
jgi:copper transport protein